MGLHASPTCQLVFDGAVATLIGGLGEWLLASAEDALERAHNFMEWTCDLAYRAAWARLKSVAGLSNNPERLRRLAGAVFG